MSQYQHNNSLNDLQWRIIELPNMIRREDRYQATIDGIIKWMSSNTSSIRSDRRDAYIWYLENIRDNTNE